jgi:hypothetical protein
MLARARAVVRKALLIRSPHAGREWDSVGKRMVPKGRATIEHLPNLRRMLLLGTQLNKGTKKGKDV